jgi:hypothetical protein
MVIESYHHSRQDNAYKGQNYRLNVVGQCSQDQRPKHPQCKHEIRLCPRKEQIRQHTDR